MAEEKNKFSPPKSKKMNDYVLSVIKSALGIIPYAGTGINELLGYLVQPSLQKRKEKWFEFIGLSLEDIINRVKKLEDITSNENFIDVAIKASRIALTTTKQEKLDALRNAVINSAIITNFNEINQHIFLIFLEQFSEYHIKFLKLLDNQIDKIQDLNFKNLDGSFLWNPNFYHLITKLNHELEQREDFCRMIMNDLFYKNLINTKDYDFPIILNSQNQYIVGKRTTILGQEFINFISESKNIE